jgi:GrpB-like predicted nucleotidyltransferase (UPF0157 family)
MTDSLADKVEVVTYNPTWPELFEAEAALLRQMLGAEVISIYHIGSTSVPDLKAKPIVDVLVEVQDIFRIDAFNPHFITAGYIPKGEYGIPGRRFFIKGSELHRSHHVHIFQSGHPEILRHQLFREYLITHPVDRQAYEDLKLELARRYPANRSAYQDGKAELIKEIDQKAEEWNARGRIDE